MATLNITSPAQTANARSSTWEQNADFWAKIIRGNHDRYRLDLTDSAILDAIGPVAGLRILDAGCGEGYLARELSSRGASVLGVDSSTRQIEAANELIPPKSANLTFKINDVASLQARDASFDLIVCNHLLNDLSDPTGPIHELSRVLAPGGRVVILMLHPCFYTDRQTRNSSQHQGLGLAYFQARRVDQRFNVDGIVSPAEVTSWHRPLEFYIQTLRDANLWLTDLREPHPSDEQLRDNPWWQANFPRPLFLLLVAQKHDALPQAGPAR